MGEPVRLMSEGLTLGARRRNGCKHFVVERDVSGDLGQFVSHFSTRY